MHRINPVARFFFYFAAAISAVHVAACTDAGDAPSTKLTGPGDAEAITPGIAVQCGAASSGAAGDNVCTEADLEAAIATAVKASGEACEAKIEVAVAAGVEKAKTEAVEEAMAQAGQSFVGVGESLDAGEWAGVDVRMLLGVAVCGAAGAASQGGVLPNGQPVLLRKMEPGLTGCSESCYAQGCIDVPPIVNEDGTLNPYAGIGFPSGIEYTAAHRQWIARSKTDSTSNAYCCCRRDFSAAPGACTGHLLN